MLRGLPDTPLIIDEGMEIAEAGWDGCGPIRHIIVINRFNQQLESWTDGIDDKGIRTNHQCVSTRSRVMAFSTKDHSLSARLEYNGMRAIV